MAAPDYRRFTRDSRGKDYQLERFYAARTVARNFAAAAEASLAMAATFLSSFSLAAVAARRYSSLLVLPDIFTIVHRAAIVALASRYRLPAIYWNRLFVDSAGLMSYGTDNNDLFRRAAGYVERILRDEKPADLPVQTPTKFELVINLKTAKSLGVTFAPELLATADEAIE